MDANKNPAQTLTAFHQAYRSLEGRNENERGLLSRLSRGLVYDPSSLQITSSASILEKYIGNKVIDKDFKNNENRNALTSAFIANLGSISSGFVETAKQSGDIYAQMKTYELTKKLMSMPPEAYNSKTVYRLLDELSDLQNLISSGVPLGQAIHRSRSSSRISKIYEDSITEYKASQLNLVDESIAAFVKGAVRGATLTPAASLDRIINTGRWVLGLEDMKKGVLGVVEDLIPDLTKEERNSIMGRTGQTVGSVSSIVGMYGVPTTPQQVAMLALAPKGIEIAKSVFGLPDEYIDRALGAVEGGLLFKIGTNSRYGQALKDAIVPKQTGVLAKVQPEISPEIIERSAVSNMMKQIASEPEAKQQVFADAVLDIESDFATDNIQSPPRPTDLTKTIIDKATRNGSMSPILSMENSDATFEIGAAINDIKNSPMSNYHLIADDYIRANHYAVNDALVDILADGSADTITKETVGNSFKRLIDASYDAAREQTKPYYDNAVFEVRSAFERGELQNSLPALSEISQEVVEAFSPTTSKTLDAESMRANIDAGYLSKGIPEGADLALEVQLLFNEGKPVEAIDKLYSLRSREKNALRKVSIEKSVESRDFKNAFGRFESSFKRLEEHFPKKAVKAREEADKLYAESVGEIKRRLSDMTNSHVTEIAKFLSKTGKTIYNDLVRNTDATKKLLESMAKFTVGNEQFNSVANTFASHLGGNLLTECKIISDGAVSDRNLLHAFIKEAGGKPKQNTASLIGAIPNLVAQARDMQYKFNLNMSKNANPSRSGVFLKNWLKTLFTPLGSGAYTEMKMNSKAKMLGKLMSNPQVSNLAVARSAGLFGTLQDLYPPYMSGKMKDEQNS